MNALVRTLPWRIAAIASLDRVDCSINAYLCQTALADPLLD